MNSKPEMLANVEMCLLAHQEVTVLQEKISYYKALIRERMKFIRHPEVAPAEPVPPAAKPDKPPTPERKILDFIPLISRRRRLDFEKACEEYNHRLKEYYVAYKEYEKACDRYKEALQKWEDDKDILLAQSQEDIKLARKNIKKASRLMKMYLEIIENSKIHPAYRQPEVLERFKFYLETGRATSIQECINLYENQITLEQLRGSQERMETQLTATIHFIQNDLAKAAAQAACTEDACTPQEKPGGEKPFWGKLVFRNHAVSLPSVPEFSVSRLSRPRNDLIAVLRYRMQRTRRR